jgi:hypothetical protein
MMMTTMMTMMMMTASAVHNVHASSLVVPPYEQLASVSAYNRLALERLHVQRQLLVSDHLDDHRWRSNTVSVAIGNRSTKGTESL